MQAAATTPAREGIAPRRSGPRFADPLLRGVLGGIAVGVLVLIGFFFIKLILESEPAFAHTGVLDFVFSNDWVPSASCTARSRSFGTLLTSVLALVIGVPSPSRAPSTSPSSRRAACAGR